MPSHLHEMLAEMFRERPALAAELLAGPLGVWVPAFEQARLASGDLTVIAPTEYRADGVVTLMVGDKPVLAIVIEAQLRVDARKRRSWPAYVATLYARLGCTATLLVVCPDPAVAEWCSTPILVGEPRFVLTPRVFGPNVIPVITDPAHARNHPEMAVMSAMAHGARADPALFAALLAGLEAIDLEQAKLYADVVLTALPVAARDCLEELMSTTTHRYQSDFARRYFAEGEARGEARLVLAVLAARGIDVPEDVRQEIESCTDVDQLEAWGTRAANATKVHDLFA